MQNAILHTARYGSLKCACYFAVDSRRALFLRAQGLLIALEGFVEALHAITQAAFVKISNGHGAVRLDGAIVTVDRFVQFSQTFEGSPLFYEGLGMIRL